MSDENSIEKQREHFLALSERVRGGQPIDALSLRTMLARLVRLPESYKKEFAELLLPLVLAKTGFAEREQLIYDHYCHYVSIPCLAGMAASLLASEFGFGSPIQRLIEHVRNLQLSPANPAERQSLERLQFDLMRLEERCRPAVRETPTIDLREPEARKKVAVLYYELIISSFITESNDCHLREEELLSRLKDELLISDPVRKYALKTARATHGDPKDQITELGVLLQSAVEKTFGHIYRGVFNGDRAFVLQEFETVIENRVLDCADPARVEVQKISSGLLALTLELLFNEGFRAFTDRISASVGERFARS